MENNIKPKSKVTLLRCSVTTSTKDRTSEGDGYHRREGDLTRKPKTGSPWCVPGVTLLSRKNSSHSWREKKR